MAAQSHSPCSSIGPIKQGATSFANKLPSEGVALAAFTGELFIIQSNSLPVPDRTVREMVFPKWQNACRCYSFYSNRNTVENTFAVLYVSLLFFSPVLSLMWCWVRTVLVSNVSMACVSMARAVFVLTAGKARHVNSVAEKSGEKSRSHLHFNYAVRFIEIFDFFFLLD